MQRDVSEDAAAYELSHELIVVAINVMNGGSFTRHLQYPLYHFQMLVLLLSVHMKDLLEPPYVNDVSYQIQIIKFVFLQELVQFLGAAFLGGKVKVRQTDRSIVHESI